jgi:two-component system phosphate regulon sensor histidine kinase PhoR
MSTNFARLRFNELRYSIPVKWLLLAIGAWQVAQGAAPAVLLLVGLYGLLAVVATLYFANPRASRLSSTLPYWFSQFIDLFYVTALIALGEGVASPLYLFYPILALKSLVYGPDARWLVWLPFAYGPLYVLALAWAYSGLGFLADSFFLARYLLLLLLIFGIAGASLVLAGRLSEVDRLRMALAARSEDLAAQARALQRTATDLGDRVLELRALQEIAKALSATLYLNDTLHTIADRLGRLVESPYCAVALLDEQGQALGTLIGPQGAAALLDRPAPLDQPAGLQEALYSGRSQMLTPQPGAHGRGGVLALTELWPVDALEVTPMMVRGRPIGALLVGVGGEQSSPIQRGLAESFAYFAATAVENARLYGDAADKRRELEAVLAGIGDGVLVADSAGRLLLLNPVAARTLGVAPETPLVETPIRGLLPADELVDLLEETTLAGRVLIRELPIAASGSASDGQPRTFQALAAPLYRASEAGEQVGGVVVVLRDITAQKELERMKSNFLSVVSHELKTPLHSIKGFVDIILMGKTGPVTELQADFLGTVQEQTGHLQRLIEDLLEFSRLESGQVRLRPVLLPPGELVRSVVDKLAPLAHKKGLLLASDSCAGLPEIEADPMRLEQVLTNLVENAIKFTPEGGRVQVAGWDRGETVEIAVIDSGIGVPAEERERIFERFYQVDSSARRRYKGTGLGLTICKHIVTQHGGRIWVADGENGGSAFHLVIPRHFAQEANGEASLDFGALAAR